MDKDSKGAASKNGARNKKKKAAPYNYNALYTQPLSELNDYFRQYAANGYRKHTYVCKETKAGAQLYIEIYPQFTRAEIKELPEEARVKKDNRQAQDNLNARHSREYLIRLINANFGDGDLWITFTYDNEHCPEDGDLDAAIHDMQLYIRRLNRYRKSKGLPSAKYIYVTEYDPYGDIRWHHHIIMDGLLPMDEAEAIWGQSSRNEERRTRTDENGLAGIANYIVKNHKRLHCEKRWRSSKGLKKPEERTVHYKPTAAGLKNYKPVERYVQPMIRDQEEIRVQLIKWYPSYDFTDAEIYYNDFNGFFYIRGRMRRKKGETGCNGKTPKGVRTRSRSG